MNQDENKSLLPWPFSFFFAVLYAAPILLTWLLFGFDRLGLGLLAFGMVALAVLVLARQRL